MVDRPECQIVSTKRVLGSHDSLVRLFGLAGGRGQSCFCEFPRCCRDMTLQVQAILTPGRSRCFLVVRSTVNWLVGNSSTENRAECTILN